MSRFNHAICDECWARTRGIRIPARLREPYRETCCYCGARTKSGIYVRAKPEEVPCKGQHQEPAEA